MDKLALERLNQSEF